VRQLKNNTLEIIIFLVVLFLYSSCSFETDNPVKSPVKTAKKEQIDTNIMTSSGSFEPSLGVTLYDCNFKIVLNEAGDTTYWSTNDSRFKTPEGYEVGTSWSALPIELQQSAKKMPGFGYLIKLNSGWQLGFCEGSSCTATKPNDESWVDWIFKRKNDW